MAGMARHGSVGAFSGFSVCQPALGASLQWLPAIGTAELDDMINAFLPGPASIQDKRAHISMDFFEYSRQTGENFKFYPVPSGSFTPVTTSPATSALYDSGYASSFNHSPVLSEGSWTQSPAPFAPAASDARTKSRSSGAKKSSTSSSRTVDFANHPGMRILTKDGQDVTNSASRGSKTKEQRDHAHLMRIIKACDACRKKKIRCDPSHRKRNASQASASQSEQKPAKRPRKAEEPAPIAVVDAPTDLAAAGGAFGPETLSFPSFDTSYPHDFEDFWNDFVTLDQEPVAVAPAPAMDDFVFDSFTDLQSFFSPSSNSTATSPSQILTPFTPAHSGASPTTASTLAVDVPGELALQDLTVPYLNPGVAHGIDYIDFNLYSPGPDVFDEDPALQMRDLGSQQHSPQSQQSPQSPCSAADNAFTHNSPLISATDVSAEAVWETSIGELSGGERHTIATSPVDLAWYCDPGDTGHADLQPSTHHASSRRLMTNHNRLVVEGFGGRRSSPDGRLAERQRHIDADGSEAFGASAVQSPVLYTSVPATLCRTTSTVLASTMQSSVSPGTPPRPRRITPASAGASSSSPVGVSPTTTVCRQSSQHTTNTVSSAVGDAARADVPCLGESRVSSSVSRQLLGDLVSGSFARLDVHHVVQRDVVAVNAALATTMISTLPTRRNVAGGDVFNTFFQLAVFGLVSFLCAFALQAHLANQVNLVNILLITSISLARLAPWCPGPSSATRVASKPLPSPTPSGIVDYVKSKIQSVTGSPTDPPSTVSRWARSNMPRPPLVRTLRL